jgi:hypothetical protein
LSPAPHEEPHEVAALSETPHAAGLSEEPHEEPQSEDVLFSFQPNKFESDIV